MSADSRSPFADWFDDAVEAPAVNLPPPPGEAHLKDDGDGEPQPDIEEILRFTDVLRAHSDFLEFRVPKTSRGTVAGYFKGRSEFARAAARLSGTAPGVYVVLNPIAPALYARCPERVAVCTKNTRLATDSDILRRVWLPIDFDPIRLPGLSSTDSEHQAALDLAAWARDWLTVAGWGDSFLADSGNGGHVVCAVNLARDDEGLVKLVLEELARRFNTATVKVDTSVHNAARIWKVYGTVACKGPNTPDRPHRLAKILDIPNALKVRR